MSRYYTAALTGPQTLTVASVSEGTPPFSDMRHGRGALTEPGRPRVFITGGVGQGVSVGDAGGDAALSLESPG